jgi:hypothetical protein
MQARQKHEVTHALMIHPENIYKTPALFAISPLMEND